MRVCIAGSRDASATMLRDVAEYVRGLPSDAVIVHGGARGVDHQAGRAARWYGRRDVSVRPEYRKYPPRAAPLYRNAKMAGMVDRVAVFWRRGSRGSENMIANAYAADVPCEVYVYDD